MRQTDRNVPRGCGCAYQGSTARLIDGAFPDESTNVPLPVLRQIPEYNGAPAFRFSYTISTKTSFEIPTSAVGPTIPSCRMLTDRRRTSSLPGAVSKSGQTIWPSTDFA